MAKLHFYSRLEVSSKLTSTLSPAGKGSVGRELSGKYPYDFPVVIWENRRLKKGLRSYQQPSARVTKPIFLVIYLGQTLKPKPQRKMFEEKNPDLRPHRAGTLLPPFGFSFLYHLIWKGCFREKKVKILNKTTKFIDDIISQIVDVSLLS